MSIHLRDGDPMVAQKVATLGGAILISVVTRVELEGGDYREPAHAHIRRARLDVMLSAIPALAFDDLATKTYGAIVASAGYARRKILDRMIAAQALVRRATWSPSTRKTSPTSLVSHRWCGHRRSRGSARYACHLMLSATTARRAKVGPLGQLCWGKVFILSGRCRLRRKGCQRAALFRC
jgi:predicted nucleic acid-binding protein